MKPNVDILDLIALQELATAIGADSTWYTYVGAPGDLLGKKILISTLAAIISGSIGAGIERPDRVYQIDEDMPSGSSVVLDDDGLPTIIEDPYLDGLDYSVHLRGVELMIKGDEWQNDVVGGGFRLTNGAIFESGQIITVQFKPVISDIIVTPDAVARFFDQSGYALVTASTTLTAGSRRKLIVVQGTLGAAPSITLDSGYPEGVLCRIKTMSGNNKQTIILPPVGQTLNIASTSTGAARFVMGQCDSLDLVRFGTQWVLFPLNDAWAKVGHTLFGGLPGYNTILANRQAVNTVDYPRLEDHVIALNAAYPGSVVSVAGESLYPSKYAYDPGGGVIYVPDYRGLFPRFLDLGRNLDPSRTTGEKSQVGSLQQSAVGPHRHWTLQAAPTITYGDAFPPLTGPNTSTAAHTVKTTSNGKESVFMAANNADADVGRSSNPTDAAPETRGINAGLPPIIYI